MPKCLNCLHELDAHTTVSEEKVDPLGVDDVFISVCAYCGSVTQLDEEGNLHPFSKEEWDEMREKYPLQIEVAMKISDIVNERIRKN